MQQSCLSHNASKSGTYHNLETNHLQKAVKYLTSCEESIGEFVKNKIVLDCLKEVSLNAKGTLPEDAVIKLKGLLSVHEFNKYMHLSSLSTASTLGNTQEESIILGITDLPKYRFCYEEILDIKCYVETLLREKIHDFRLRFSNILYLFHLIKYKSMINM